MVRLTAFAILSIVVIAPAVVDGQNARKKKSQVVQGTADEYSQLKKLSEVFGKLAAIDTASSSNRNFALDVPYQYPVTVKPGNKRPNAGRVGSGVGSGVGRTPNFQSQMQSLAREQEQILRIKNPAQREQRMAQFMMKMQNLQAKMQLAQVHQEFQLERAMTRQAMRIFNQAKYAPTVTLATGYKEFQLEAIDEVVVRRQSPPIDYDDKGNVKKYSKEELEQLKGKDKTLPGYTALYQDLKAGQTVKVYLKPRSEKKDDKAAKKDDNAEKKDDAADKNVNADKKGLKAGDEALPASDLPQVRMILLLADAPITNQADPAPAKNKKNQ